MKILNIGGKDYTVEFTIEASLYNECTEKVAGLMLSISEAENKKDIREMIGSMSDIPQTTLTMFYAGLLEHHGEDGDRTVLSKKDAKGLIKHYFSEHTEDGTGNFYGVMEMLLEVMMDDGFFNQIGLGQRMDIEQADKTPKTPQDHKKKEVKATRN